MPPEYDSGSLDSIFRHSKLLLNKTLRDFAPEADERKGKGGLGQLVEEYFFNYKVNSRQEQDFPKAKAELKCTPLKRSSSGNEYVIKERLVCSMINYVEDWDKPFELSHFYLKCRMMLILFYLHQPDTSKLDLRFIYSALWRIPDKDLAVMRHDYDTIISKIAAGQAHTLSEGDTMYLGACRKGQKGESGVAQHGSATPAFRRAWSLKTSYMRIVLQETKRGGDGSWRNFDVKEDGGKRQLFAERELRGHTVEEILTSRFLPFIGKSYNEICSLLGVTPSASKSRLAIIANAIATKSSFSNINRTEEFEKSGLTMKTIRVGTNGRIKESMSFENIDYQEVSQCDEWTDSRLYELFSSRFLFVIFDEKAACGREPDYTLRSVRFWTMPQADLAIAQEYWQNIRLNVMRNTISPKFLWNIRDNRKFHVRPKARNGSDKVSLPNGETVGKYCYWFNAEYVIIRNEQ